MGKIFITILSAVASEMTFVISFLLIYNLCMLLHFVYILLRLKKKYGWFFDGILCSVGSIFLSCYISFLITKKFEFSEMTVIIIGCILPIIGEVEYFRFLRTKTKPFLVGRLHQVLKNFLQRGEFAASYTAVIEEMVANNNNFDMTNKEVTENIAKEAYNRTQWFLTYIFMYSVIGYIIGLVFIHFFLF